MSYLKSLNSHPRARVTPQGVVIPDSMNDEAFRGEYDGDDNLIYKGFGRPGLPTDAFGWQVAYLTYDGNGNVLSIQWPCLELSDSTVSGENVGTVTTPWTSFSGTLDVLPIKPGSLTVVVGALTFVDQGDGTLDGGGSNVGTIDYVTGALTLTINPALMADEDVIADYMNIIIGTASNDYQFVWDNRHNYVYL